MVEKRSSSRIAKAATPSKKAKEEKVATPRAKPKTPAKKTPAAKEKIATPPVKTKTPAKKTPAAKAKSNVFIADRILDVRIVPGRPNTYSYLVKWEGYGDDANTWEPEVNLLGNELVRNFWAAKNRPDLAESPSPCPEKAESPVRGRSAKKAQRAEVDDAEAAPSSPAEAQAWTSAPSNDLQFLMALIATGAVIIGAMYAQQL